MKSTFMEIWNRVSGNARRTYSTSHGEQPSSDHLIAELVILLVLATGSIFYLRNLTVQKAKETYQGMGVKLSRIARTALEIERKTFHLTGLVVPILFQILVRYRNYTQADFAKICWVSTCFIWIGDSFRVMFPSVMNYFPYSLLKRVIRDKEIHQLSGTCYFSLGCTLAISIFPPAVSTLSIIWLVLGDMSAALIGVSFGGETVSLKMGREGKKSVEGSIAMFCVCFVLGMIAFAGRTLSEYAVLVGSLIATLVELYEPLGLNDNITIPVISCFALQFAFDRLESANCRLL